MDNNEFYRNHEQPENPAAPEAQTNAADINNNTAPSAAPAAEQAAQNNAPQMQNPAPQYAQQPPQNAQPAQNPYASHTGYNPYAGGDEPAVQHNSYQQQNPYGYQQPNAAPQNGYAQQQPGGYYHAQPNNTAQQHDFSRYQNTASGYTQIPRETVYINNTPANEKKKKEKAPKGRLSAGAVALVVVICMVFSGGAAFAGTYAANKLAAPAASGDSYAAGTSNGTPSVIFQSYTNENTTPGTYEQVASAVTPTVVEITTESVSTSSTFWGGSYVTSGAGSGVIVSEDGMIITNAHVVSGANTIHVKLKDGTKYDAKFIGSDSDSDIAVIKIEATGLPFALTGDSDSLAVGNEVVAVGNPLGELGGTVTNGIISALSRDVTISGTEMTLIQTNAAVNPGNSGGGLFNMYGELIGIVNAKSTSTSSGTSVEGIGFAIPINTATKVASELVNYGYVRGKVMLGINYVDVTSTYEAMYYGVNALGMYIAQDSEEGFKAGDRVTALNGKEVTYGADVKAELKNYKVGDEVTLTVVRGGQYVDVKVTLKESVPKSVNTESEQNSRFESNFQNQSSK